MSETQHCPECGETVAHDAAFCEHCGHNLSGQALVESPIAIETPVAAIPVFAPPAASVPPEGSYLHLDPAFVESLLGHVVGRDVAQVDFKRGVLSLSQQSQRFTLHPSQLTGPLQVSWEKPQSCLSLSLNSIRLDASGLQVQLGLQKPQQP